MNNEKLRKNEFLLIAIVFLGFFVFGISENIKGPAIPKIQSDFGITELEIGSLLSLNFLGYMLACSFTGFLILKKGLKFTLLLGFTFMTLAGALIYLSPSYNMFAISYFVMYLGNGILEIILSILAAKIFIKNTGKMMNLSHFFYGLSSIIAPICATVVMSISINNSILGWKSMYLIMLSLCVVPIIPSFMAKFPEEKENTNQSIKSYTKYIKDPVAWLIVLLLSFGVISELSVGGWLVNYLEKVLNFNDVSASGMLSAFFIAFTLSRLLLGPLTDKLGYIKSVIIFSALSGVITFIAILGGKYTAILFALSGIGIALIYPTVMAFISTYYKEDSDTAITYVVTVMGVILVIGNYFIGFITDLFSKYNVIVGLKAGYFVIGGCAILCSVFAILLYLKIKNTKDLTLNYNFEK